MQNKQMALGMPTFSKPNSICSGCLMAKQVRKPFPSHANFRAKQILELVHGDLCGPISPTTSGGNRYFLLLVDDFSRMMWVYMIKSKDEAFTMFKRFKAHVEKKTER